VSSRSRSGSRSRLCSRPRPRARAAWLGLSAALAAGCVELDAGAPELDEAAATATAGTAGRFIPIGADYDTSTLSLFAQQAVDRNRDGQVQIRLLLPPYAVSSTQISSRDRAQNLTDAQVRANQILAACQALVAPPVTCAVTIPDVQIRTDALDPAKAAQFGPGVDGVYALGGDQVIAMEIIAGTPVESALAALHADGVPLGGNSAGCAVQGRYMIAGLTGSSYAWDGLEYGSVDLAYDGDAGVRRGLSFGIDRAIVEQHALQRGRLIRSLQAVQRSPGARIGLGPDWRTGVVVADRTQVSGTSGLASVFVIDEETYGAAQTAAYRGDRSTLSLHNVGLHLLAAGPYGYDLTAQRPTLDGAVLATAPTLDPRRFDFLAVAPGGGPLFLGGDLLDEAGIVPAAPGAVIDAFAAEVRAAGGSVALVGVGSDRATATELKALTKALTVRGLAVTTLTVTASTDTTAAAARLASAKAIYVTAEDQAAVAGLVGKLAALNLDQLRAAGKVLLLDNAAAAAAGDWMHAAASPADDLAAKEDAATPPYLASYAAPVPGLGLMHGAAFEARAFYDYRFGHLVQHAYRHPGAVAFGIERETALRIDATGARVVGPAAVLSIDPRAATHLEVGTNGAIAAFWLVLDTFAGGEPVRAQRL
jgi:cyanophycinase